MKLPKNRSGPTLGAWKKGYQACLDGKSIDKNPYYCPGPGSVRWFLIWREGWNAGKEDLK